MAKRLGFSLTDIRECLDLYNVDPVQIEQQQLLIIKVRQRIKELEQQQKDLARSLAELRNIEQQTVGNFEKLSTDPAESEVTANLEITGLLDNGEDNEDRGHCRVRPHRLYPL